MHARPGGGGQHARGYSQSGRAAGIAKQQELSSAYSALAAELTRTEVKSVGGYTLGRVIGQGTFGKVRLGVHRLTGTRVAIKQVSKSLPSSSSDPSSPLALLTREIHHHRRFRHPHVLSLYELIATESSIYLVSELCAGGELFDYLVEKGRLSLAETRTIFGQLAVGIAYLHGQGVVHRDLKLENVLLDERCQVKIADLGFGREFERGKWMDTWVGTLGYCAPEVVSGKKYLGEAVDIWSLGVILYALVTGSLPFDDDDEGIMKEMILKCDYEIPSWLDEDAADLIRNILILDPLRRFSLKQILSHAFFTRPSPALTRRPTFSRSHSYASSLSSHQAGTAQLVQEEFDHPPAILEQEETNLTSSPTIGFLGAEVASTDPGRIQHGGELARVAEGDETTSQSSHFGSASQSRTRASSPSTSIDGPVDQVEVLNEVRLGKLEQADLNLELQRLERDGEPFDPASNLPSPGKLSAPPSPVPPSRSSFETPSLRRNRSNSSSVRSLPFHTGAGTHGTCTPHARTPARTKRRSIGSIISERLVSLVEEDQNNAPRLDSHPHPHASPLSPGHAFLPRVDYLALMLSAVHRGEDLFSSTQDRDLIDKLNELGFDTGQMRYSVENSACDSTSATFWMLKKKMDEREADRIEAAAIAAADVSGGTETDEIEDGDRAEQLRETAASSSLDPVEKEHGEEEGEVVLELPTTNVEEPTPTQDVFSNERLPSPPPPPQSRASPVVTIPATGPVITNESRLDYFLGQHDSNGAISPAEYFPTIDPGSPTRRRTKSRDDLLLSPRSNHSTLVPLDSPLELSPSKAKPTDEESRNRRSRSGSVTLLARATSALNNSLSLKGREEGTTPEEQPQSSGLFRRKSSLPLDEAITATATNRTPPPGTASAPGSPRRTLSSSPFRDPSTPPRPARDPVPLVSPGPSPSVSLANSVDTFDTIASTSNSPGRSRTSTATGGSGSKKGTKGSQLLANLKFWFGDAQRKRNKSRASPARGTIDGSPFPYGSGAGATGMNRSHSLTGAGAGAGGSFRGSSQSGYVASPLRRPVPGSRRSSNASIAPLSRRSSVSSAHRGVIHDQLARPQLAHHRRRSDSSRTSISGGDQSRPQSVRSFTGGAGSSSHGPPSGGSPSDVAGSSSRRGSHHQHPHHSSTSSHHRHGRAPSTSSAGSFSKEAVYRRPPTTTTVVRRRHPSHGRHNHHHHGSHHRRTASGASSIRTHRSSTSSIGEGGASDDDEAFGGEAGEAPILEEDETEDRGDGRGGGGGGEIERPNPDGTAEARLRALRTLSGEFGKMTTAATVTLTANQDFHAPALPSLSSSSSSSSLSPSTSLANSTVPPKQVPPTAAPSSSSSSASSFHLARPPLPHHPSSRASSRSDTSSRTRGGGGARDGRPPHAPAPHATFAAHKSTHLFGSPLQPSAPKPKRSTASTSTSTALPPPPSRPPLRDVFASNRSSVGGGAGGIGGDSDWIDEDELDGYGGGLGQGTVPSSAATGFNYGGAGFASGGVEGTSTFLEPLDEKRAAGSGGSSRAGRGGDSPTTEKTFGSGGGGGISLFEGRFAGVNGSGLTVGAPGVGTNGRGVRTLSAIKTVVIEEDEEEEEEE